MIIQLTTRLTTKYNLINSYTQKLIVGVAVIDNLHDILNDNSTDYKTNYQIPFKIQN